MSVEQFLPISQLVVETFYRMSENYDLQIVLDEKSGYQQSPQDSSSEDRERSVTRRRK